jgi:hypothetical protein
MTLVCKSNLGWPTLTINERYHDDSLFIGGFTVFITDDNGDRIKPPRHLFY